MNSEKNVPADIFVSSVKPFKAKNCDKVALNGRFRWFKSKSEKSYDSDSHIIT